MSFGYDIFESRNKISNKCREQEKEDIRSINCTDEDGAVLSLDNFDSTLWRTRFSCHAYNPTKICLEEQPLEEISSEGKDTFFRNSAAGSAFITISGYTSREEESIISLARADALPTACIFLSPFLMEKVGKGTACSRKLLSIFPTMPFDYL